MTYLTDTF